MAKEASAVLFGVSGGFWGYVDIFWEAMNLNVDIVNASWLVGDLNCDMYADTWLDQVVENAFDDGILVVFSAGNTNGDDATSCTIRDPADTPKALIVKIEDMTIGVDVSEFKLSMFVRPNAGASCTGTSTSGRISNNNDLKRSPRSKVTRSRTDVWRSSSTGRT